VIGCETETGDVCVARSELDHRLASCVVGRDTRHMMPQVHFEDDRNLGMDIVVPLRFTHLDERPR
jgi:hypothetical protein